MTEKQFGSVYGPPLQRGDKVACIVNLRAEIDRRGGVPYGWLKIYEVLLFAFYSPQTGQCFPSHQAIADKARCSVSTVQRALKWARENALIVWAHGLVRDGWRVLRTSNRYAFAGFLSIRQIAASIAASNGQKRRGIPTSYKSFAEIAAEARTFGFPPAPSTVCNRGQ
ncbi:MAG: helix-turn-helix domain-containing protein [Bryobacteraceae bacterium]